MTDGTVADIDISVIITAHREGLISSQSARSAEEAIAAAAAVGLRCETIVVLDNADELTRSILQSALADCARFVETSEGDPGEARNRGVAAARGRVVAFLDADDLWSQNWLSEGFAMISRRPGVIAHSACNLVFGRKRLLWWHPDSETALFDESYLDWTNCWDALTIARTEIYKQFPFRKNNLALGFAHEDWHWNIVTLRAGIPHKPVPNTMHFKRARLGSQMERADRATGVPWTDS